MDLPPDPFLPDDPRLRDDQLFKYMDEAKQLVLAFSYSSLIETLHRAERRDIELAALFLLTSQICEAVMEVSKIEG